MFARIGHQHVAGSGNIKAEGLLQDAGAAKGKKRFSLGGEDPHRIRGAVKDEYPAVPVKGHIAGQFHGTGNRQDRLVSDDVQGAIFSQDGARYGKQC